MGDEINEDVIYEESKKPKEKSSDYAKIAKAISTIQSRGINLSLININTSDYGFKPDIKNNRILYGLKAISNINSEIIELIKKNRPYNGIKDFMIRCPLKITAMVNLIKAGAFDEVDTVFTSRKQVMAYYLSKICEPKTKLNLQNFNGLLQHDLIPKELELTTRVYNFNKYLKTYKKIGKYYQFDDACMEFFNRFLVSYMDEIEIINGIPCILQTKWEKIYQTHMNPARTWLKENQTEMLKQYNAILFKECWDKYASGNESHWEMDSLCFYYGDHELKNIDVNKYGISDFFKMPETPIIDYFYKRGKNNIPIYKLYRIIGTVLAKDDKRCSVILLTTTGVVTVKFTREYYSMFKKQISQIQPNGKKKVMEKGWFKRGSMIMVTGFRRDDQFVGKTYKATVGHQLYKITEVKGTDMILQHERWTSQDAIEEDEVEW